MWLNLHFGVWAIALRKGLGPYDTRRPASTSPFDFTSRRHAVLGALAAVTVPAVTHAEEDIEAFSMAAGLARLSATVEQAAELVELSELAQLQQLLRSAVMVSWLGFEPIPQSSPSDRATEQQVKLIMSFPADSQRKATEVLGSLLTQVSLLDRACLEERSRQQSGEIDSERLRECVAKARGQAVEITQLYFRGGCMVCSEPVKSVIASDATWENPGLAKLDEFAPRLLQRPERSEEDWQRAKSLGFRPD